MGDTVRPERSSFPLAWEDGLADICEIMREKRRQERSTMQTKVNRTTTVEESLQQVPKDVHYWRTRPVVERFAA
jgi:hypothetical protein